MIYFFIFDDIVQETKNSFLDYIGLTVFYAPVVDCTTDAHAEQNFNGGLDATFWFEGTEGNSIVTVPFVDVYASHRESMVRAENGFGIMDAYTQGSVYMPFASSGMSLYFDTSGNMHYDVIPDVNNRYTYKKRR